MANSSIITLNVRANNGSYYDVMCPKSFNTNDIANIGGQVKVGYNLIEKSYQVYNGIVSESVPGGLETLTTIYMKDGRYLYVQETSNEIQALINACCQSQITNEEYQINLSLSQANCELVNGYALDVFIKTDKNLPLNTQIQILVGNAVNIPMPFTLSTHPDCGGVGVDGSNLVVLSPSLLSSVSGCKFRIYVEEGIECTKKTFKISIVSISPSIMYVSNILSTIYNPPA
jgi:hypothetical protein